MANTAHEYATVIDQCRQLFTKKAQDYGTAWRILRLPSLTDQIFIKANRLRSIQMAGTQKVADPMEGENHDYGEAWRDMRISSLTDLILQKLLRVKQIEDNQGQTLVSEGIDANYQDMVNYAAFALIKLQFPA